MYDEAEIFQALSGDRTAFEALAQAYWPIAEGVARRVLGDAQLAQDVAQEVFADIYMQRAQYQPRVSFHAFVSAMARYKSIDLLRRRGRTALSMDAAGQTGKLPGQFLHRNSLTPEDIFVENLFRHSLYALVEGLPERQRRILKAYALEGRSYQDIAAELTLSVSQVKITLHRIRKKLRRVKDDWDV